MEFWTKGKKMNTETMTAKEMIVLLNEVETELQVVLDMIAEFNTTTDVRKFSLKHFGRDGDHKMYTDRVHVADRLKAKWEDLVAGDRCKALLEIGCEPINFN
jgi:hypothetical protein